MINSIQQLFAGALLGDVAESIIHRDLYIVRCPTLDHADNRNGRCSHSTSAYGGGRFLGTAKVTLEGTANGYKELLEERMRDYLKDHGAQPTIEYYDEHSRILARKFRLVSMLGILTIHEQLFIDAITLLDQELEHVESGHFICNSARRFR